MRLLIEEDELQLSWETRKADELPTILWGAFQPEGSVIKATRVLKRPASGIAIRSLCVICLDTSGYPCPANLKRMR
jgi:hypothetical protein